MKLLNLKKEYNKLNTEYTKLSDITHDAYRKERDAVSALYEKLAQEKADAIINQ